VTRTASKKTVEPSGLRIRLIRDNLKISQKDFAAQLGISGSALSEMESGKYNPRIKAIRESLLFSIKLKNVGCNGD